MIGTVKRVLQVMPRPIGGFLSRWPYARRPFMGKEYRQSQEEIGNFPGWSATEQHAYIVRNVRAALSSALSIPFFRDLYQPHGLHPEEVNSLEDVKQIPIVSKEMLQAAPIDQRSAKVRGRFSANTGGSSGNPLDLFVAPRLIPVEWAHMHAIWGRLGYNQSCIKLTFAGVNTSRRAIVYDGMRHQYSVNVFQDFSNIAKDLHRLLDRETVSYLHGYPSAIAEFADNCERDAPALLECLKVTLRGAFLSSEFPADHYRSKIEGVFGVPTISWYGHTERSVLAWEGDTRLVYHPFQTYGYCEVVPDGDTGEGRLIGTSYFNSASPFIRYDTGDIVEAVEVRHGVLSAFRIRSGRVGEFILDRDGVRVPLTALVFGRHHRLFGIAAHVQVRQVRPGHATIIITPKGHMPDPFIFDDWFDSRGARLDFDHEVVDRPILTERGKVTLLVR